MFKPIRTIDGLVNIPLFYNKKMFTFRKDYTLSSCDTLYYESIWSVKIKTQSSAFFYDNNIFPFYGLERIVKIDIATGEVKKDQQLKFYPFLLWRNMLVGRIAVDHETFLYRLSLIDFEITKLSVPSNTLPLLIINDEAYCIKKGDGFILSCFNLYEEQLKWETDLNRIGQGEGNRENTPYVVSAIVGAYEHSIIANLSNKLLAAFDIQSGKLKWLNDTYYFGKIHDGKVVSVAGRYYTVIDILSGKTEKDLNLEKDFDHHKMFGASTSNFIYDNHIYFVDVTEAKVAAFSMIEERIVWSYQLPDAGRVTIPPRNIPQVYENRLYVLDSAGTLHIFERE